MDKKLIARRIRQYRHLEKISQETLADRVGVSDTYIRKLEAGDRTPSLEPIYNCLSDAFFQRLYHNRFRVIQLMRSVTCKATAM